MDKKTADDALKAFQSHDSTVPFRGYFHRDPLGARIFRTGRAELNTAGSEMVRKLAGERYPDLTQCGVKWYSNEETGQIAGRLVSPDVKGATPIRSTPGGNLTLYMTNAFVENPKLKPQFTSWVSISGHGDSVGPYILVHLKLALKRGAVGKAPKTGSELAAVKAAMKEAAPGKAGSQE